jgi:NAD(P)H-nitrite reductase large subunit
MSSSATCSRITGASSLAAAARADLVIEAVGARPKVGLAETAALDIDDGVLVDEALRTSKAHIWAVGDIANHLHPFYGTRIRS